MDGRRASLSTWAANNNRQNVDLTNGSHAKPTARANSERTSPSGARAFLFPTTVIWAPVLKATDIQGPQPDRRPRRASIIGIGFKRAPWRSTFFIGAARLMRSRQDPAYGIYYGAGLQWRNVVPRMGRGRRLPL